MGCYETAGKWDNWCTCIILLKSWWMDLKIGWKGNKRCCWINTWMDSCRKGGVLTVSNWLVRGKRSNAHHNPTVRIVQSSVFVCVANGKMWGTYPGPNLGHTHKRLRPKVTQIVMCKWYRGFRACVTLPETECLVLVSCDRWHTKLRTSLLLHVMLHCFKMF